MVKLFNCSSFSETLNPAIKQLTAMYENKTEPLISTTAYYRRIAVNTLHVTVILAIMLVIGTLVYHYATYPLMQWLDAFHNASMILSGMGPIVPDNLHFTNGGKIFSSLYALFSGIVFVSSIGYILAPGIHRIFHRLHFEQE
jgi:hypothetical protein